MTSLSDTFTATAERARAGWQHVMGAIATIAEQVRPTPETRSERARREAREFLERRREALGRAFDARTR